MLNVAKSPFTGPINLGIVLDSSAESEFKLTHLVKIVKIHTEFNVEQVKKCFGLLGDPSNGHH